jgi:uncharacterized Ntn-hydrolase superfamily protein
MKSPNIKILCIIFSISLILPITASATFSIVAVDTVNNVVGSAGASCIAGSQIIHDVLENVGAINTQAWYLAENQDNAHDLLYAGWTPEDIINWLENNDAENSPHFRQYGVVTLAGSGASAGYTGYACSPWKGHLTGPGYAIQGNILLGPEVIDSMEYAFLNTNGPLEDRLMAALEAANIPGADTRCLPDKPALSAYIRVIRPGDGPYTFLYRVVNDTGPGQNPIDSLRILYDAWTLLKYADPDLSTIEAEPLRILANGTDSALITVTPLNGDGQTPISGAEVVIYNSGPGTLGDVTDNGDGTFTAYVHATELFGHDSIFAEVTANEQTVELTDYAEVYYHLCGDANGDFTHNILDISYLINYLYQEGPIPFPFIEVGDCNGDGTINILDITYMIAHLYMGGPAPMCPPN